MPPGSDPVLLYVPTAEALAAWSLVDLRLVCASCAVDLRLVCAWAWGSLRLLFFYVSLSGPVLQLLKDCHGSVLSGLFEIIPSLSGPVLLSVPITEALAAFSLVDLRLVCASSAPGLHLVCAWSALRAPWGCFFLYASLTGPALTLLKDCLGSLLGPLLFFLCLQQAILCYSFSTAGAVAASSAVRVHIVFG